MRPAFLFLLVAGFFAPYPTSAAQSAGEETLAEYLTVFQSAFLRIERDGLQAAGPRRLVEAAIAGLLSSIDPQAAYFDKKALSLQKSAADTVGLAVTLRHGALEVIAPSEGSPAAKAGIKSGDIVLTIGREPVEGLSLAEFESRLEGPPGSVVRLRLERHGLDHPLRVRVRRQEFRQRRVADRLIGALGYLRVCGFDAETPAAVAAALKDLEKKSARKLRGLILDLRDNPGGNFRAAVEVADLFLDKGVIAFLQNRGGAPQPLRAHRGDVAAGLPIAVLIDRGTAGEAELVAAALKDNRRAVLLGRRSFGLDQIEKTIPLKGGGAIRLAAARFLTPLRRDIAGRGIAPDIPVRPVRLERLKEGLRIREADLPGALKNPDRKGPKALFPATAKAPFRSVPPLRGDESLLRAADILRAFAVTGREGG